MGGISTKWPGKFLVGSLGTALAVLENIVVVGVVGETLSPVRSGVMGDVLKWMRFVWRTQNGFDRTGSRVGTSTW